MAELEALARTRAIGGSLVVTIPSIIVKEKALRENELVKVKIEKVRKSFFGALKGVGPFTKEDELKGQLEE